MSIKTSTLVATAKAIYRASSVIDNENGQPVPSFERLPPNTKDLYAAMAKAAAEAIDWQDVASQGIAVEHELRIEIERLRAAIKLAADWIDPELPAPELYSERKIVAELRATLTARPDAAEDKSLGA